MPEISKIKLTSGDEYNIKDTTAREMISSHTHTNESMGFGYGTCDTAQATTAKTVSISGYTLSASGIVYIKFNNDVPANATLNISSTGDKPIYYNGSGITADIIKAGDTATFIYDGTNYNLIGLNNTTNASMGFGYAINFDSQAKKDRRVFISGYELTNGGIVSIKFNYAVPEDATLNISSTGAKPIVHNGGLIKDGIIKKGDTATFIYDGASSSYILIATNNFTNASIGFGYGTCSTAASTTAKTVSIFDYKLTKDGIVSIKFTYDVSASSTLNIYYTGDKPIYYNGSAITDGIIKAGDTATFIYDGTNYNLISLDRDFNPITVDTALSTTSTNPVQNNIITDALNNHTHTNESMGFGYCHTNYDYFCGIVDDYALTDGNIILCEFTNDVPADAILNINNTGDKPIYYNGSPITYGIIKAGDTAILKYNENLDLSFSRFDFIDLYDFYELDANNSNSQEEINIDDPIYEIEIINGQNFNILFYDDVPANATLNINDTGAKPIYYNGSPITNDIIKANDNVIFIYNINDGRYDLLATDNYNNENVNHYYYGSALICYGITLDGYTQTKGGIVSIKFYYDVEPNATLNINSTGAKSIYHNGYLIRSDIIKTGDIATFIYDGTRYNLISLDRDFNIINESMGFGYGTCITAASTTAKTVSMYGYELTKGGMVSIKFYNNVLSGATLNINNTGAKPIYHDGEGLSSLNSIIKAGDTATFIYNGNGYYLIARGNITNENMGFGYGTCDTAASTTAKTVSISNYKLTKGGIVSVKFTYSVPANATLNISDTGAKYIYYNGSIITDNIIKAGDTATFIYDGTNYKLISLDRDFNPITIDSSLSTTSNNPVQNSVITNALNNHTHDPVNMGFGYGTCITAASTTAKTVSMYGYKLTKNGIVSIRFSYDVPADATLNINNTGDKPIYYKGSSITDGIIKVGDIATFIYDGTNYRLISLDRDFNSITIDSSLSTTSNNPVQNNVITNALNNKADSTHTHINESMGFGYGTCDTAQTKRDKIVSISGYVLINGGIVSIRFNNKVLGGCRLNINDTGAKNVYYNGYGITDNIINAGDTATFIYDGTNYNLISLDKNFSINNENMGFGYGTCDTAASTTAKTVSSMYGYKLTKGGIVSIIFNYDVPANATLNINDKGAKDIIYNGTYIKNGIIKAGDTAIFIYNGTNYNLISLDRDFNDPITVDSSLSTTSNNPVQNNVITNALNNYIPIIVGTQIESTNNWTGNAQFEMLEDGQRILYYLPYDNSSGSDVVLNLTLADGTTQTGNINCYLSGSTRLNSQYEAGNFIPLIYKENIAFNGSSTTYTGWWAYTDKDIDSKVQNTLNNTTKAYITGTTNNTTNIGTQIFDNNVYLGTTAGELNTKSLKLNEKVTLNYNTNNNCIDFTFS